jgi:6-phosphofructokinase 1
MIQAEVLGKTRQTFQTLNLHGLIVVGGDGSLNTAQLLHEAGFPVVGVPKTIDNDLEATSMTFGFNSAVECVAEALNRLHTTATSHKRVIVLEVMGRHAGWVAWYVGMAGGADWVTLPEEPLDVEAMCAHLNSVRARGKKYALIVASEGTNIPTDDTEAVVDSFGHVNLSNRNVGEYLASEIEKRTGWESRHAVVGHVHRGGAPTLFDRVLGMRVGMKAADLVNNREFGKMAALVGTNVVGVDIVQATSVLKTVPADLLELIKSTRK